MSLQSVLVILRKSIALLKSYQQQNYAISNCTSTRTAKGRYYQRLMVIDDGCSDGD